MSSWLEDAAQDGHEPEMKPQEIPCEEHEVDCTVACKSDDGEYWK